MALTEDQTAFYRRKLGTGADLADIEVRLARLGDDQLVVLEVLEERLATLVSSPASFTVPGEYSQDTRENIKQLQVEVADARRAAESGDDSGIPIVTVQPPYYAVPRRTALDTEEFLVRNWAGRTRGGGR